MSTQPNIVLVTADSLRADHCGFLGCKSDTTPTLDKMASDGLVFENAISPGPRTPSSMPVIFTGGFPANEKVPNGAWQQRRQRIGRHLDRYGTFVERLRSAGYTTVGFTVNPWISRDTGFHSGFDWFSELDDLDISWPWYTSLFDKVVDVAGFGQALRWGIQKDWFAQWTTYYDEIQARLETISEPFFLWVFALDPHLPYITPAQHRVENSSPKMWYGLLRYWYKQYWSDGETSFSTKDKNRLQQSYRDTVKSVDVLVSRLERDTPSGTAFVFHSDHGEAFMEHGSYGHQRYLYEENIHVPLLGYNLPETGRITETATLAKLPEFIESIASNHDHGESGANKITKPTTSAAIAQTENGVKTAVRTTQWKYIDDGDEVQLFNLKADPHEKHNRKTDFPNITAELAEVVKRRRFSLHERREIRDAVVALEDTE